MPDNIFIKNENGDLVKYDVLMTFDDDDDNPCIAYVESDVPNREELVVYVSYVREDGYEAVTNEALLQQVCDILQDVMAEINNGHSYSEAIKIIEDKVNGVEN